ncbi:MAG: FAD:protein FMN transferase [Xanthobacteraceae bacterium]|nr:MAG: FAD:protein FMN transferase [Xanthobacteraceae bacterium]
MPLQFTRRRMIAISAAAAGLGLLPPRRARATADVTDASLVTWRGTALGAPATMQIHHHDRAAAESLIARAIAEVRRLEALFSLYRSDSALVDLNRHGVLAAPAPELVDLLMECRRYSELSGGRFDATVQPLWTLYADHFARDDADPSGPEAGALARALACVGYENILVNRDRVAFARPGVRVTLNGIAQGYITDRVVDLLRAAGITQTLVDMGETRCLDAFPDGRPWQVGIADPDQPGRIWRTLSIVNQAVATSGGYGFRFDPQGRFNHLFDPATGHSAHAYRSVSVVAATATAADALSTAFSFMTLADIERVLAAHDGAAAHLVLADGTLRSISPRRR